MHARLPALLLLAAIVLALAACTPVAPRPDPTAPAAMAPTAPAPAPTVAPPTPTSAPAAPQRISFAPGANDADVKGAAVRGEQARYLLWAAAGQQLDLTLASQADNGAVVIWAPDGTPLPGAAPGDDARRWAGLLPATGDYTLEIGPTRGSLTFWLQLRIVTPTAPPGPIRSTDWDALLRADPAFTVRQLEDKLFVSLPQGDTFVDGHPLLDAVVYGDFDGDRVEDAAIMLGSGGTAGNVGLLVYRAAGAGPALAAALNGYKLWAYADNGQLVVRMPIYAGWESNCCPSGMATTRYVLQQGALTVVEARSAGRPDSMPDVVRLFYERLGRRQLIAAYALLSDAEQASSPYGAWAAGYADTVSVTVDSVAIDASQPDTVRVVITAADRAADGGQVVRRFAGTWQVRWDPDRPGYTLAGPQIQLAP